MRGGSVCRRLPFDGQVASRLSACVSLVAAQETTILYLNKWDFFKRMASLRLNGRAVVMETCRMQVRKGYTQSCLRTVGLVLFPSWRRTVRVRAALCI